jgi:hypothetical protein
MTGLISKINLYGVNEKLCFYCKIYVPRLNERGCTFSTHISLETKIPLKIKIFMWFLRGKVLLAKDNLVKRKWNGCTKCCFCESKETVQHLYISCLFSYYLAHDILHI